MLNPREPREKGTALPYVTAPWHLRRGSAGYSGGGSSTHAKYEGLDPEPSSFGLQL